MGSKTAARQLARTGRRCRSCPGTTEALADAAEAQAIAERFGYPVLLKAAAGGGGKGMRVVARARGHGVGARAGAPRGEERVRRRRRVRREVHRRARATWRSRCSPTTHGRCVSLGERECSVQRRHQKMIEEAPSVAVTPELRARDGRDGGARWPGPLAIVNAGTCEFLLDRDGNFYFLEMNTRLQVEHPVTEFVTGIDLVQWQLRVAAGERHSRSVRTSDADAAGPSSAGSRARIRPTGSFRPPDASPICTCPAGPGVRWDGGVEVGSEVGLFYDPMLAKLIVWAADREAAVNRMHRALLELTVDGIETSRDFHLRVMEDEEFRRGDDRDSVAGAAPGVAHHGEAPRSRDARGGDRRRAARRARPPGATAERRLHAHRGAH